jgi:hypothetical protein
MDFNDKYIAANKNDQQRAAAGPNAYREDDDDNIDQKDLERTYLFGQGENPANPTEGKATGGKNFGQENNTPAGDDKNNPSQNAGYTNKYFARNEPSDEHPEDSNFTEKNQDGAPEYSKAQPNASGTDPKPDKVERGDGENDRPNPQSPYREGTDDNDGASEPNIPGPEELPDQQKVGEPDDDHIET